MSKITIDRALLEQALEALENWRKGPHDSVTRRGNTTRSDVAIAFLRAALAQEQAGCETEADCTSQPWCRISGECHRKQAEPAQEPVAVVRWNDIGHISWRTHVMLPDDTPLYTAPPQRPPLTDKEITDAWCDTAIKFEGHGWSVIAKEFARAIERKVRGEKE